MYFDKTFVKIIGSKWDEKKKRDEKNVVVGTHTCNDGMNSKKFMALLDELSDAHDAHDATITVELKQYQE